MAQVSTFRIDGSLYGIDILHIKEISKIFDITPVPGAPRHIVGLMNLRGQIVSILDPSILWNNASDSHYSDCRLMILKTDEQIKPLIAQDIISPVDLGQDYLGFVIDEVGNVIEYGERDILPPPPHLEIRDMVKGIVQLESEVVIVFNTEKLVAYGVKSDLNK